MCTNETARVQIMRGDHLSCHPSFNNNSNRRPQLSSQDSSKLCSSIRRYYLNSSIFNCSRQQIITIHNPMMKAMVEGVLSCCNSNNSMGATVMEVLRCRRRRRRIRVSSLLLMGHHLITIVEVAMLQSSLKCTTRKE